MRRQFVADRGMPERHFSWFTLTFIIILLYFAAHFINEWKEKAIEDGRIEIKRR